MMWLSFADGSLPKGSQFLGVVIVDAENIALAAKECWDRRINPGGEICGFEFYGDIPEDHKYKLLSKEELEAYGYLIEKFDPREID